MELNKQKTFYQIRSVFGRVAGVFVAFASPESRSSAGTHRLGNIYFFLEVSVLTVCENCASDHRLSVPSETTVLFEAGSLATSPITILRWNELLTVIDSFAS